MTERFASVTSIAMPLQAENVDTDQIIPARFLKVDRAEGYGKFLFHDLREHPGFILNRAPFDEARILVANRNFGCGSSREAAVYALHDAGFRSVIAPSFGDIFYANCLKNGIVPVRLPEETCRSLRKSLSKTAFLLTVDLPMQEVRWDGEAHPFDIDPFSRELLLEGVDEVGLTLTLVSKIEAFERAYGDEAPWLRA